MWVCYVIALIPVLVGAFLWLWTRRITFKEWMIGSVIGFAVAVGFHFFGYLVGTIDLMIVSGPVEDATHWPRYGGRSEDEDGWPEYWTVTLDLGDRSADVEVTRDEFERVRKDFGATELSANSPRRSVSDDDYRVNVAVNHTGVVIPGWTLRLTSRADIGSEFFGYTDPPDDAPLFEYPFDYDSAMVGAAARKFGQSVAGTRTQLDEEDRHDWRYSGRLLGRAKSDLDIAAWDALNARVFPATGANLIAIGFDGGSVLAQWQEAKWGGGKRNDLVLCYGSVGSDGKPGWTYCFGWAEDETVKRQLESVLLLEGFGEDLLPAIERTVREQYRPKVFAEVGWFEIPPPDGAIASLIIVMILVQGGYWSIALVNRSRRAAADDLERQEEKEESERAREERRERSLRKRLAERLAHLGPDPDVATLKAELLGGKEPYFAAIELSGSEEPGSLTALIPGLTVDNFRARECAEDTLNEFLPDPAGCPEGRDAIPDLVERLGHRSLSVRRRARRVLDLIEPSRRDSEETKREIADLAAKLEMGIVAAALLGLAEFGRGLRGLAGTADLPASVRPHLTAADSKVRRNAIRVTGWLGGEGAIPALVPFLTDDTRSCREAAIEGLGALGDPDANRILIDRLADADRDDRIAIATALRKSTDPSIIGPLIDLFRCVYDGGTLLPERIVAAIWTFDTPEVRELLESCVEDFHCPVQELAATRLGDLRAGRTNRPWI